jgi:hypothetical protein
VVLRDDFDPMAIERFEAQPPELSPIAALRAAMRETFADAPADQIAQWQELNRLTTSVPELRTRALDEWMRSVKLIAGLMAKRLGRDPSDLVVRTLAGAIGGIGMSAMITAQDDPSADITALMDAGLELLEAGLPL